MKAGLLDRRITIQSPTSTRNSFGEAIETWGDVATLWASKLTLRVAEAERQGRRDAGAEFKFAIRYRSGLTANMRVVFDGSPYEIVGIEEIGRREGLNLLVRGAAA